MNLQRCGALVVAELPTPISKSRLAPSIREEASRVDPRIRALGADLRNDLNNPLQEIVAMVFVAQATGGLAQPTNQALEAIDRAAKNMATVVSKLEEEDTEVVKR